MSDAELEKMLWELRDRISKLETETTDLNKNKTMLWRAIKSLRGSILALSTKEAKRQQQKELKEAEERGAEQEKLRRNWIKRFIKWVGAPTLAITFIGAGLAWVFSFLKEETLRGIIDMVRTFFE
jgi:hypothetical protein